MKSLPNFKNSKGISLVEVIMAVFLTGVIALVVANIPQTIRLVTGSQSETKVREVAAEIIEDVRLTGYDNLANGATSINDSKLSGLNKVAGSTTITDCPVELCTNGEQVKKVTVVISWDEDDNPKSVRVVTLVGRGGLK